MPPKREAIPLTKEALRQAPPNVAAALRQYLRHKAKQHKAKAVSAAHGEAEGQLELYSAANSGTDPARG